MRYSSGFKQGILRKVLPPESRAVAELSRETRIAEQTIRNWMERAGNGALESDNGKIAPGERRESEKLKPVSKCNHHWRKGTRAAAAPRIGGQTTDMRRFNDVDEEVHQTVFRIHSGRHGVNTMNRLTASCVDGDSLNQIRETTGIHQGGCMTSSSQGPTFRRGRSRCNRKDRSPIKDAF